MLCAIKRHVVWEAQDIAQNLKVLLCPQRYWRELRHRAAIESKLEAGRDYNVHLRRRPR